MSRKWAPPSYPVRDPRSTQQKVGRIINPVRAMKLGGKGENRLLPARPSDSPGASAVGPVSDRGKGRGR
jgi:hypothetical protein